MPSGQSRTIITSAIAMGAVLALAGGAAIASGAGAPASVPATPAAGTAPSVAPPGPPGFGVFYVNGVQKPSNWSDNRGYEVDGKMINKPGKLPTTRLTTTKESARVTYLRPENPTKPNIVLVPGYGLSSDIWMTTPDLRQGWAQMLYNEGYSVYVLSPPDRGESMEIDQINKCKFGKNPTKRCKGKSPQAYYGQVGHASLEPSWTTWRFGPKYKVPYPDSKFPSLPFRQNYVEQFGASFTPYLGTSDIAMVANVKMNDLTSDSLAALLSRIGPSVIVLHSAAGTAGYSVAENDSRMVKAVVAIETTKCPVDRARVDRLATTPFLGIWGDNIDRNSPGGHWERRKSCQKMAAEIRKIGEAPAKVLSLPRIGITGNSHMMMQDTNNADILNVITGWLTENGI